jgi:hypothetical protein
MITVGQSCPRYYPTPSPSPRRHAARHDYAEALASGAGVAVSATIPSNRSRSRRCSVPLGASNIRLVAPQASRPVGLSVSAPTISEAPGATTRRAAPLRGFVYP